MTIKIKGDTNEQKFEYLEKVLNRMRRKLHKTVIGVMTPIPVMFSTEVPRGDGEIFTFLCPASGTITDVCMVVKEFDDQTPVEFIASVEGQTQGSSAKFRTRKNLTIVELNLQVKPGDLLTLKTSMPDNIRGIWLSFLYQMGINKSAQANYIADELYALIEEENFDAEEDES